LFSSTKYLLAKILLTIDIALTNGGADKASYCATAQSIVNLSTKYMHVGKNIAVYTVDLALTKKSYFHRAPVVG
jgi:hypothetical protein